MAQIAAASTEWVRWRVDAVKSGLPYDPTSDPVSFAVVPTGQVPAAGDWTAGSWETWPVGVHVAQVLVGADGTITVPAGEYDVWVKIVDVAETPIRQVGTLIVT